MTSVSHAHFVAFIQLFNSTDIQGWHRSQNGKGQADDLRI